MWGYNKSIDINKITKIKSTSSFFSSPAGSVFGRIEISYNKFDKIIISPKDKIRFIDSIKLINNNIEIH